MVFAALLGLATGPEARASADAATGTRAAERFLYGTSAIVQSCAALALAAAVLFQLSRQRDERESLRAMLGFPAMPLAASGAAVACAGGVLLFAVPSWLVFPVGSAIAWRVIQRLCRADFLTPASQRLALFLAWPPASLALVPLLAWPGVRGLLMMLGVAQSPPPLGEALALLALSCSFVGVLGLVAAAVVATVQWMSVAWVESEVGEAAADLFVAMVKPQLGRVDARGLADTLQKLSRWAEVAEPREATSMLSRLAEREEGGLPVDQAGGQHIERLLLEEPKELLVYRTGADNLAHSLARLTVRALDVPPLTYRKLLRPFLRAALPRSGEIHETGRAQGVERGLAAFMGAVARQLPQGAQDWWAREVVSLFGDARELSREVEPQGVYVELMQDLPRDEYEHAELLLADCIVGALAPGDREFGYGREDMPADEPSSNGEAPAHWAPPFLLSLVRYLWQYHKADWAVYIAFECAVKDHALAQEAVESVSHKHTDDSGKVLAAGLAWWSILRRGPAEEAERRLVRAVLALHLDIGPVFRGTPSREVLEKLGREWERLQATRLERAALLPFQWGLSNGQSLTCPEFRCLRYTRPNWHDLPWMELPPLSLPLAWRAHMAMRRPDEDDSFRNHFAGEWTRLTRPMRWWFMWYLGDTWARERAVEGAMNLRGLFSEPLEEDEFRRKCEEIIRFYLRTAFERDTDIDVKHRAAAALAQLDDEEAWEFIREEAGRPEEHRRARACLSVAQAGRKDGTPLLLERLRDPAVAVRRVAAQALGALQAREAVQPLAEMLSNQNETEAVRAEAAKALGAIGRSAAVEALEAALQTELPEELRHQVEAALKEARRARPEVED